MTDYTLYHGDCLIEMDKIPDGSIDAAILDPPYGLGFEYTSYNDSRDNLVLLIKEMMPSLFRISNRIIITPGQTQITLYPEPSWVGCITWNTTGSFGALGYNQWMPYLFYGSDIAGFGSVNGVRKSDTHNINGGGGVGFMRNGIINHPCPKPLNIMEYLVNRFTSEGDVVIDPLMGSGTTGVACGRLNRSFVGIEQDAGYFEIAKTRIMNAYDDFVRTPEEIASGQMALWEAAL